MLVKISENIYKYTNKENHYVVFTLPLKSMRKQYRTESQLKKIVNFFVIKNEYKKITMNPYVCGNNPLVSVILTFYNEKTNILRPIASLERQLHKNIEIIFVDDCSTDGTAKYVEKLMKNVNIPYQMITNDKNIGTYMSKNRAIDVARGAFITFIDADDEFLPNKIVKDIKMYQKGKGRKLAIYSRFKRIVEGEHKTHKIFLSSSIFCPKFLFKLVGPFMNTRFAGDTEFFDRMRRLMKDAVYCRKDADYIAHIKGGKHLTSIHKLAERSMFVKKYRKMYAELDFPICNINDLNDVKKITEK